MVVAVTIVRVMQVTVHHVVHVIAVRNLLMTAVGTVNMARLMSAAIVPWGALVRVVSAGADPVIINVTVVYIVHVTIVKVIGMPIVANSGVAAIRTVHMGVPFVRLTSSRHDCLLSHMMRSAGLCNALRALLAR
jgi:hypothetical protein